MSVSLAVRSCPSTLTVPLVTSSSRLRQRRKVDFPDPEGPMMDSTSPLVMEAEMPLSTSSSPKDLRRSMTSIMGPS